MSEKTGAQNFFAFIIGAALGAAVTSLLVPRSGSKTREAIRARFEDIRDRLGEGREYGEQAYVGTQGTDEPPPPPSPRRTDVETHEPEYPPPPRARSSS